MGIIYFAVGLGSIEMAQEIFRIIYFSIKDLLHGLIISLGIIVLLKYFSKDIINENIM
jgi:hypothetical protein